MTAASDMTRVITALRRRRLAAGLTQDAVAARAGVTRTALSRWECAHAVPDTLSLFRWAEALGERLALGAVAPAVPEGWRLVPAEPTAAQLEAACKYDGRNLCGWGSIYRDMIAAAPSPAEPAP